MSDNDALGLRREPEQDRSRAGVEAILDATAELLDHQGIDQITMTAIAAGAGLSKAALYRYFPNKAAIIRGLAHRIFERDAQSVADALDDGGGGSESGVDRIVDGMRSYLLRHRAEPHRVQLRAAVRADPELSRLDLDDTRRNAEIVAATLVDRGASIDVDALATRVLLILELADGVIRLASIVDDDEADQVTEEFLGIVRDRLAGL
ncbi:MAG: TetR/AcrR family transcriptional regulator [Actinomycetota bacterium]